MKKIFKFKGESVIITVIIAIAFLILIFCAVLFYPSIAFNMKSVEPNVDFAYKNSITCTIVYSSNQLGFGLDHGIIDHLPTINFTTFTLTGLETDNPKLLVNGEQRASFKKQFNDYSHLTLILDSQSWETENISLMKNTGSFVRTITGIQAGEAKWHYAVAQKGRCE